MIKAIVIAGLDIDDEIDETKDTLDAMHDERRKLSIDLEHAQIVHMSSMRRIEELQLERERLNAAIAVENDRLVVLRSQAVFH